MNENRLQHLREILNTAERPASYREAKLISEEIDRRLGFQLTQTEKHIFEREMKNQKDFETWNNLSPQAFQTPYSEFQEIVQLLNPPESAKTWVDLGAAYGRLGLVLALQAPLSKHIGYEISPERAGEGARVAEIYGLKHSEIRIQDLSSPTFMPEDADFYFIYDYGKTESIRKTITDLKTIAARRPIHVIARGLGIQNEIDRHAPWLCVNAPHRLTHSTIYRS